MYWVLKLKPVHASLLESRSGLLLYVMQALAISLSVYYLPSYSWLEFVTAVHSGILLQLLGMPATIWSMGNSIFLNEVEIIRACTGGQVIAAFMGLLLPFPGVAWWRKLRAILIVALGVYILNVVRIVFELGILYRGILPWSLAHYPTGLILGIISVAILLIGADRFIPEFGDIVATLFDKAAATLKKRKSETAHLDHD